jgi:cold shock CspA family protein
MVEPVDPGVPLGPGQGIVVEFDDPRGLGVVRSDAGVEHPFHCTAISDGTRSIEVGSRVTFRVGPGRLGRWEASELTPTVDGS